MTRARTDLENTLIAEVQKHGGEVLGVYQGRKHKWLVYEFKGDRRSYSFSGTPSSRNAALKALRNLRGQMGVKRIVTKNPARKPRKRAPERPKECPALTPGRDGFAALAALRALPDDDSCVGRVHAKCTAEKPAAKRRGLSNWLRRLFA